MTGLRLRGQGMTSNITAAVAVNRPIRTVYNQWSQRP